MPRRRRAQLLPARNGCGRGLTTARRVSTARHAAPSARAGKAPTDSTPPPAQARLSVLFAPHLRAHGAPGTRAAFAAHALAEACGLRRLPRCGADHLCLRFVQFRPERDRKPAALSPRWSAPDVCAAHPGRLRRSRSPPASLSCATELGRTLCCPLLFSGAPAASRHGAVAAAHAARGDLRPRAGGLLQGERRADATTHRLAPALTGTDFTASRATPLQRTATTSGSSTALTSQKAEQRHCSAP